MSQHTDHQAADVGASFQRSLDNLFGFLPNVIAFLIILLVGWLIAKLVQKAVKAALEKAGIDGHVERSDAQRYVEAVLPGARPSSGIARIVFWIVFAFFFFSAIGALKIPALTTFMNQVLAYLPNVIVAILIFVAAAALSGAAATGINRVMGDSPTGRVASSVVPALIMVIAMFMILEQLRIAEQIVEIAFAATVFALALGLALAFGLGGRPIAQRLLEDAYESGRRERGQSSGRRASEMTPDSGDSQVGAERS